MLKKIMPHLIYLHIGISVYFGELIILYIRVKPCKKMIILGENVTHRYNHCIALNQVKFSVF